MITLDVHIDGDGCWPDLANGNFVKGDFVSIARLTNGTTGGNSSVCVRIELPDGRVILAETTMALINNAIKAFLIADKRSN